MVHFNFNQLSHPGIQNIKPYIPGKSIEEVEKEYGIRHIIKAASNENAWGCSSKVQSALKKISKKWLSGYPQYMIHPLRQRLADFLSVDETMVTLGSGSDSLINLLVVCFAANQSKHVMTHQYAFMTYGLQAQANGVPLVTIPTQKWEVDISAMIEACNEQTALIFIANPNNPTGVLIKNSEITRLLDNIPQTTLLVLDEAYCEYAFENTKDSLQQLKKYPNLIILRTFSKAYGLAGLRLGYAVSHPEISQILCRIQLPFSINIAALIAGEAAIDDQLFIQKTIQKTHEGLRFLEKKFDEHHMNYIPSHGNFITIDCQKDANLLFQQFQEYGIILRPLGPYQMPHHLRITVGTQTQNQRLIDVCKKILFNQQG